MTIETITVDDHHYGDVHLAPGYAVTNVHVHKNGTVQLTIKPESNETASR